MKTNSPSRAVTEAHRHQSEREQTYREQALKLYPLICGKCGREFAGKRLAAQRATRLAPSAASPRRR